MTDKAPPADDLVADALLWDAHAGVFPDPSLDLDLLEAWSRAGFDHLSLNVGFDVMPPERTLATLHAYRGWLLAHPDRFVLVGSLDDLDRARAEGKLAVSFDIEGMNALDGDVGRVEAFAGLGVRQMLFAYNRNNAAGGGCHDADIGLTAFGRDVLAEMNRVGMIVDASHTSLRTSMELIERSVTPAVFSHSNPAAVWPHGRNISDAQIKACAGRGGVVGINGLGIFLGDNDTSPETVLRHVFHLCDLVGPEHVGLGLDYSPNLELDLGTILSGRPDYWPAGQRYDTPHIRHAPPSLIPDLLHGMRARGLTESELRGILGQNFRRIAARAWTGVEP